MYYSQCEIIVKIYVFTNIDPTIAKRFGP